MTYQECVDYLFSLHRFGIRLGLESMRELCAALDHPEKRLRFVHLAGTNGKGSTAALIDSILREAGYKTGLYTSPHLIEFAERIRVNGEVISRQDVVRLTLALRQRIEDREDCQHVSFFEFTTAMALLYFQEQGVELVVWETGLGGRLDATNVVHPECAVVTNIDWDHQEYLGDSLAKIASEKAGIFKAGCPVVIGEDAATEAGRVLTQQALDLNCPIYRPESLDPQITLTLLGRHQKTNAAVALKTVQVLAEQGWNIPKAAQLKGLKKVQWQGRFQVLSTDPLCVLDGAHNAAGVETALKTWREEFSSEPAQILFSCVADKDVESMIRVIDRPGLIVHLVSVATKRMLEPEQMQRYIKSALTQVHPSISSALTQAREDGGSLLIIGSLYLAGEVLALRQQNIHELKLNG